jgi:uncharacterized protein (DUF362 family)
VRSDVHVHHDPALRYPAQKPYGPSERYPELEHIGPDGPDQPDNPVYRVVRKLLFDYGLDAARFGTSAWNPLGHLAPPGGTIVIKPNLVLHEVSYLLGQRCLCTDGAVVRPIVDYALRAVGSTGRVVIADAPLQGGDFSKILAQTGIDAVVDHWQRQGAHVSVIDLRRDWAVLSEDGTQILRHQSLPGDPAGYTTIDLGQHSFLDDLSRAGASFSVTDYDEQVTNRHHVVGRHEYMLSNTVLHADAVINVPKLKTHQKAGLTAAMKNFVGINGSKDYLAHHRPGAPSVGGDEFPQQTLFNLLFREVRRRLNARAPHFIWKPVRAIGLALRSLLTERDRVLKGYAVGAGGWYGNETIWRTIYDINTAFFRYDIVTQTLSDQPIRKYLAIVDGIVAGEGDGPLRPTALKAGVLMIGESPIAVDMACANIMGFDPAKIPMLRERYRIPWMGIIDSKTENGSATSVQRFRPPMGWRGHVEASRDPIDKTPPSS